MDRYIVMFDKSNEDVPTLIVGKGSWCELVGPGLDIIKIITGSEAIRIWDELSNKSDKKE